MRLATIVAELKASQLGVSVSPDANLDIDIVDVHFDSRRVEPGSLFCCVPGASEDGHSYAQAAIDAGALALLVDHPLAFEIPQIVVDEVKSAMAVAAAACFGHPSDDVLVVGITGTNGKTTTTWMLRNIFLAANFRVEVIGTLSGTRTTPEAPDLQRTLAQWRDAGVEIVAMEVSSHAIDQHRVDAMKFRVAAFTNLSRDHLDYHGSMEEYFETKARLFDPEWCDRAVVNLDSPYGHLLADAATVETDGYSIDEVTLLHLSVDGSSFLWSGQLVELTIGGSFNISNALAAAHIARSLGIDDETIAVGLSSPLVVEGRFERVDAGQPFPIVVDYAHTPDGLEKLLQAAREVVEGRVILVFGCGGDRDHSKRALMGEVAASLADVVVLTADNSRSESTADIIESILQGVNRFNGNSGLSVDVEPDRRAAITLALSQAKENDIVLLAGKGHETVQILGGVTEQFDDRVVAIEQWKELGASQ